MGAFLGDQRASRAELALPGNGNTLLAQAEPEIGFVLVSLDLFGSGAKLLLRKNLLRPTGKGLELEYALLRPANSSI